jgi:hypothetical protein
VVVVKSCGLAQLLEPDSGWQYGPPAASLDVVSIDNTNQHMRRRVCVSDPAMHDNQSDCFHLPLPATTIVTISSRNPMNPII